MLRCSKSDRRRRTRSAVRTFPTVERLEARQLLANGLSEFAVNIGEPAALPDDWLRRQHVVHRVFVGQDGLDGAEWDRPRGIQPGNRRAGHSSPLRDGQVVQPDFRDRRTARDEWCAAT